MAGQPDGLTDVLCLHQPVAVPPQLSDEGRYSVLLFFDTASVLFKTSEKGGGGEGGERGRWRPEDEDEGFAGRSPECAQGVDVLDHEGGDTGPGRSRQQACHDLSKAMAILLADGDVDDNDILEGVENDGAVLDEGNGGNSERFAGGRREGEGRAAEGEDNDVEIGGQDRGEEPQRAAPGPQQRFSPTPSPASPPVLSLSSGFDAATRDMGEEIEEELLEARLARECGIVDDTLGGSVDLPSSIDQLRPNGGWESKEEEEEEERATGRRNEEQQQRSQPISPAAGTSQSETAEYSSGDESTATPRFDLLLSPHRPSPSKTEATPPTKDERGASSGTTAVDGGNVTGAPKDGSGQPSAEPRNLRLSLDGYEDDFCCEDEDESSSGAPPPKEEGRKGAAGRRSFDLNDSFEGGENKSGIFRGNGGVVDDAEDGDPKWGYASSSSDGVYSGTAAGGLERNLNGNGIDGGVGDGIDDISSWDGSPDGRIGEGDDWDIRSPPRSSANQAPSRSSDLGVLGADGDNRGRSVSEEIGSDFAW